MRYLYVCHADLQQDIFRASFLHQIEQYLITGSTLTAVGPFQLTAPQSGTLSQIRDPTISADCSDVCLKRICSLDTSAFSSIEFLDDNHAI